jgi:hypothetical protein
VETDRHPTGDAAIAGCCRHVKILLRTLNDKLYQLNLLLELDEKSYQLEGARLPTWGLSIPDVEEDLSTSLIELMCQLRRQFALEEFGHWLEDEPANSLQYLDALQVLYAEHDGLLEQVGALVKLTESPPYSVFTCIRVESELSQFAARLADHERREGNLIQRIMCTEVGVVD